jgi:hypothetical protein
MSKSPDCSDRFLALPRPDGLPKIQYLLRAKIKSSRHFNVICPVQMVAQK